MTSGETRSPIRTQPRRQAGTTASRAARLILVRDMRWPIAGIALAGVIVGLMLGSFELLRWPLAILAALGLGASYIMTTIRFRQSDRVIEQYKLGAEGERAVADAIEELIGDGYRILHDIPGEKPGDANIDHLIIGPGGIFVIETKTRRKPVKNAKNAKITYDGTMLRVNGAAEMHAVDQVRMLAGELRNRLARLTGRRPDSFPVQPILVFPGWYIDEFNRRKGDRDLWLLNENALIKWIRNAPTRLSEEDVALFTARIEEISSHLSEHQ